MLLWVTAPRARLMRSGDVRSVALLGGRFCHTEHRTNLGPRPDHIEPCEPSTTSLHPKVAIAFHHEFTRHSGSR
jgi:hypothetical protein